MGWAATWHSRCLGVRETPAAHFIGTILYTSEIHTHWSAWHQSPLFWDSFDCLIVRTQSTKPQIKTSSLSYISPYTSTIATPKPNTIWHSQRDKTALVYGATSEDIFVISQRHWALMKCQDTKLQKSTLVLKMANDFIILCNPINHSQKVFRITFRTLAILL